MATKKKAAKAAPKADLKALAAQLGVPVKEGKVTVVRDRYFVTIGATKKQIPVGEIIDAAAIKPLAGKVVSVVVSGRTIVAIADAGWRPPIITCYIPAPDFIKGIREELRVSILKGMVERQIITPELQQQLLAAK